MTLNEFVERYSVPYNPIEDNYECLPFDKSVKSGKNTSIYSIHPYHTKVPPEGIEQYIEHYTKPGDLILDPFCGSGMTGIAALKKGRSVILNDLSPAACHISYNYCTPIDIEKVENEFENIKKNIKDEIEWLYGTKCDCGENALIQHTIWSDVYLCNCNTEIILWDVSVDKNSREFKNKFNCPNINCQREWSKSQLKRLRSEPIITNYFCPQCGRKSRSCSPNEKSLIEEIEAKKNPYWYPIITFDSAREMWRAVHRDHNIDNVSKFFTKRNLWASSLLWYHIDRINDNSIKEKLKFAFTAFLLRATKLNRLRPSGAGDPLSGTLYIGSLFREDNVLIGIFNKIKALSKLSNYDGANSYVRIGSANKLPIGENQIDYIFTDPPFGSNIFYSDVNLLWESWIGKLTDEKYEAVVHIKHKNKNTLPEYKKLMREAFEEMYRVLKPNRWSTVVFSNSNDKVWASIQEAAYEAGFVVYGGKEFDKIQRSFKGTRGAKGKEKVATKDVILNLHKPKVPLVQGADLKKVDDVEGFVLRELRETLLHMPLDAPVENRTSEALARAVTRRAISQGYSMKGLSFNYVEDVLVIHKHEFVNLDGKWYFTAAKPDLQRIVDERSAIVWLTTLLSKKPRRFDEINPLWQQEINKTKYRSPQGLKALLDTWFLSNDGYYYPPDEYERKQLKGLVEQERYREAERYRMGKLDRQPSVEEIFQWIELYYTKQEWRKVIELSKVLDFNKDWEITEGAKSAKMRIQLAMSKVSVQEKVINGNQQELF
jgi:DNA modification methylase